jgi:hypothetical protein
MKRPAIWRLLVIVSVAAMTVTVIYSVRQHNGRALTIIATASRPALATSPSRSTPIVRLRQSFVTDPPFGSGFTTHGTYLQVSGVDGLDAINVALRKLVLDDQAQDRADLAQLTLQKTTPPGEYGSGPGDPAAVSANSVVVSVLLKTEMAPPDGEFRESWVSATLLVPSAHPVQLDSLFADPIRGLSAIAGSARDYLLTHVPCAAQALTDPTGGGDAATGLDPTNPENFQHFAMTPDGLVIGFEQNQIGPHACGNLTAMVDWNTLRPLLSPVGAWLINQLPQTRRGA